MDTREGGNIINDNTNCSDNNNSNTINVNNYNDHNELKYLLETTSLDSPKARKLFCCLSVDQAKQRVKL